MRTRPPSIRRALLWCAVGLTAAGCGSKAPDVTGLIVTISFQDVAAEQLELSVSTMTGTVLMPKRRPEEAGAGLSSPQSVSIYLPDGLADQEVTCTVTAVASDRAGATGTGKATLTLHKLVPLTIELRAVTGDDAATDAGQVDAIDDTGDAAGPADDASDAAAGKANGLGCTAGDECESTLCVDGVCCASACKGMCEACNVTGKVGTCAPEPAGTTATLCADQGAAMCGYDGTCDGNRVCRRYPAGVACKAAACQGSLYVPASACDGQGACVPARNVDCAPYVCDATAGPPACRTTCRAGSPDCMAPAVCAANSCGAKPLKAPGAGCVAAADCASNFCVDGVCCAAACSGPCISCNQAGKEGMCLSVGAGKADPHMKCANTGATSCGTNGLCDGAGRCALYPADTVCASGSCNNRMLRSPGRCDGKGVCTTVADIDCQPYRCDPMTTACFTSCTSNAQCSQAPRRTCGNNSTCGQ